MNHSANFVDPATGVCTNAVEGYWSRVKQRFKRMAGTREALVPAYLDEHMWRDRNGVAGDKKNEAFMTMVRTLAQWYPCP